MVNSDFRAILFCFFVAVFSSCSVKLPVLEPQTAPVDANLAAQIIAGIRDASKALSTFKGLYRVQVKHGDKAQSMRYVIIFERPEMLRLEFLPTAGAFSLSLLVSNGQASQFVDFQTQEIRDAGSVEEQLEEILRLPALKSSELVSLLLGAVPEICLAVSGDRPAQIYSYAKGYLLISASGDCRAVVSAEGRVEQLQLLDGPDGRVDYELNYSDYRQSAEFPYASLIRLHVTDYDVIFNLRASSAVFNSDVKEGTFDFYSPVS